MNWHNVHLLDLSNEILFIILKKLDNIDVLYSLLGINNQRLDIVAEQQIFSQILNFVCLSQSTDEISSISGPILDRFCIYILPRIHKNVESLIVESVSMECILRAGNYPNLTKLKLFNFNKTIASRYFTDDSLFGYICKQQITDLILIINESNTEITIEEYTKTVYAVILTFFESLKHLTIALSSNNNYPLLSLCYLPPITFSSSTLTKLCINVQSFDDCLALLDGRLKQLTKFIVEVGYIFSSTSLNMDDLPNLKCFSLTCYNGTREYDYRILPLLHRMSHLEELTLYIHILGGPTFIVASHLDNKILIHMPRLRTFTFYMVSGNDICDSTIRVSNEDIQRTFRNIKYREVICIIDYCHSTHMICRVFSLPFRFHRLEKITNNIPNIIFNSVTDLKLWDKDPFKHEFFIRLTRAFPFLKNLSLWNIQPPFLRRHEWHLLDKDWCSIIEYPHLISLDISDAYVHYLEHFLDETKTLLPRLTKLKIDYRFLKQVTKNFTNDETRRNCAGVKLLIAQDSMVYPTDVYDYFPSLSV